MMDWIVPITQSVIAGIVIHVGSVLYARIKASISNTTGVPISAGKKIIRPTLRIAADFVVLWFLFGRLMSIFQSEAPPTRIDEFMIAFWVSIILLYVINAIAQRTR